MRGPVKLEPAGDAMTKTPKYLHISAENMEFHDIPLAVQLELSNIQDRHTKMKNGI